MSDLRASRADWSVVMLVAAAPQQSYEESSAAAAATDLYTEMARTELFPP